MDFIITHEVEMVCSSCGRRFVGTEGSATTCISCWTDFVEKYTKGRKRR